MQKSDAAGEMFFSGRFHAHPELVEKVRYKLYDFEKSFISSPLACIVGLKVLEALCYEAGRTGCSISNLEDLALLGRPAIKLVFDPALTDDEVKLLGKPFDELSRLVNSTNP
jgi:hypothetical protein